MHGFVAGATGVLGKRIVTELTDRGHEVAGLVRDDEGAERVASRGGDPRRGDVLEPSSLERAVPDSVDVVVHAATALPTDQKPSDEAWAQNDRVRLQGAKHLVAATGDTANRFIFPSIVWVARQPDGSRFDESAERHPDRATRSAAETEDYLREAASELGFDAVILRLGYLYGPDSAHTRAMAENLVAGDMPIVGGGLLGRRDAELSMLHADDAGRAFADAIEAEVSGCYHVVDDEPVPFADYLSHFTERLDAPEPRRIPGWLARFFVGAEAVNMLTNSFPTSADRFREDTDWDPEYPTYRAGLDQIIETWAADGSVAAFGAEAVEASTAESPVGNTT